MPLLINTVTSELKELKSRMEELQGKLDLIDNLETSNEVEVAELVGEYMTEDINKDDLEDEFEDVVSKVCSLEDILNSLSAGKKLDAMQFAFLSTI